jgi:hypothetical protein
MLSKCPSSRYSGWESSRSFSFQESNYNFLLLTGMLQSSGVLLLLLLSDTPSSAGVAASTSPLMPLLLVVPSTGITPS